MQNLDRSANRVWNRVYHKRIPILGQFLDFYASKAEFYYLIEYMYLYTPKKFIDAALHEDTILRYMNK